MGHKPGDNEWLLRHITANVGTGVAAYSSAGGIVFANEHYASMLETDVETLEQSHITEVNPQFDRERFGEYWQSFEENESRRVETVHRSFEGGRTFPVDVTTTRARVEGKPYHVGTIQDISTRKEFQRELRLYKEAVRRTGHMVLITDEEGEIQYVNPAFEEETGYDSEEALGEQPSILKSDRQEEEFYQDLWETILDGEVWEAEVVNRRKSGELFHAKHTIAPITDRDGDITHFVGIQSDITGQKLREKRLSELNRILRHNLRNTVTALKGHIGRLERELDDQPELETILDQTESLQSTSEKATKLRQFLDTNYDIEQQCDVGSLFARLEPEIRELYPDASITFEPTSAQIRMDEETCRSILTELIDNAVFHNDRQTPEVSVTVSLPDADDHVTVQVADNGPGIPDQERSAINVQEESQLVHGSGMGLSHVHWVVTQYGGEVRIRGNDPRGSVVTLSIPSVETS